MIEPDEADFDDPVPLGRRHRWLFVAVALAAVVGLLGLSLAVLWGDDRSGLTTPERGLSELLPLEAEDLAGRTFVIVALEEGGVAVPLAAEPPVLAFGDTSVELHHLCEELHLLYGVDRGQLAFDVGTKVDFQGCGGTAGGQSGAVLSLILSDPPPTGRVDGDVLEVRNRDVVGRAVDVTRQPAIGAVLGEAASAVVASALGAGAVTFGVTPSAGLGDAWPVVTVVDEPGDGGARRARAVVVAPGEPARVVRVPTEADVPLAPAQGATLARGDRISYAGVPVEGGAAAHVNGVEVPVDVDQDALTTSFRVPAWARGEIVVTLSLASPEEPTATAGWYRVG